jgi:hypothetical protein
MENDISVCLLQSEDGNSKLQFFLLQTETENGSVSANVPIYGYIHIIYRNLKYVGSIAPLTVIKSTAMSLLCAEMPLL